MLRVTGDDMEHEQDTVLQLQEVIEQLRNVFPSEPGQLTCTPSVRIGDREEALQVHRWEEPRRRNRREAQTETE